MTEKQLPLSEGSSTRRNLVIGAGAASLIIGGCLLMLDNDREMSGDDTHQKVAAVLAAKEGIEAEETPDDKTPSQTEKKRQYPETATTTESVSIILEGVEAKLKQCGWKCRLKSEDKEVRCTLPEEAGFGLKNYLFITQNTAGTLMIARSRDSESFIMVDAGSSCDTLTGYVAVEVQRDNHELMQTAREIIADTGFFDLTAECAGTSTCTLHAELLPLDCGRYRGWFTDAKKVGEGKEYQATISDFSIEIPPTADEVTVEFHAVKDDGMPVPHNNGWTRTLNPDGLPDFITTILESHDRGIELSVDRTGCSE